MAIDLEQSLYDLKTHIAIANDDKYNKSPISNDGIIFDDELGKGFNIGNATKYISRYVASNGEKTNNPKDLIKAIHYLLFEYKRVKQKQNGRIR